MAFPHALGVRTDLSRFLHGNKRAETSCCLCLICHSYQRVSRCSVLLKRRPLADPHNRIGFLCRGNQHFLTCPVRIVLAESLIPGLAGSHRKGKRIANRNLNAAVCRNMGRDKYFAAVLRHPA